MAKQIAYNLKEKKSGKQAKVTERFSERNRKDPGKDGSARISPFSGSLTDISMGCGTQQPELLAATLLQDRIRWALDDSNAGESFA
jgi:hypothetical protein